VATRRITPAEIAGADSLDSCASSNVEVLMAKVQDFDLSRKVVKLEDGEVSYDYLIVAAGPATHTLDTTNGSLTRPGLKTIEDALEIRRRMLLCL